MKFHSYIDDVRKSGNTKNYIFENFKMSFVTLKERVLQPDMWILRDWIFHHIFVNNASARTSQLNQKILVIRDEKFASLSLQLRPGF